MFLDKVEITAEQDQWCRRWLRQWYRAEDQLTNDQIFSEFWLVRLLKLELSDRCRGNIIRRIESRYNILRRRRERREINETTRRTIFRVSGEEVANAREDN